MKSAKHSQCAAVEDFGRHRSWQRKLLRSTISVSRRTPPVFKHSDAVCFSLDSLRPNVCYCQECMTVCIWLQTVFSGSYGTRSLSQEYADWVRWLETHWHIDHFVQKKRAGSCHSMPATSCNTISLVILQHKLIVDNSPLSWELLISLKC